MIVKDIHKYLFGIFVAGGIFFLVFLVVGKDLSLEAYADGVIRKCENALQKQECYSSEIPKLMKKLTMENTFKVTTLVQEKDPSFLYCHVLGHTLASIEIKKNPDDWKNVVGRCPSGVCSNGCVHGAFQERYRSDVLLDEEFEEAKRELEVICEEREGYKPSGVEQGSCYHSLGHLLMYITGADIDKAVTVCDEISKKTDGRNFSPLCYDGAFMQIFQPLGADDIALIRGQEQTKENAPGFCANFSEEKKASCWSESWPLSFDEITTPGGALNFCSYLSGEGREDCIRDIFYTIPIQVNFNQGVIKEYCRVLPVAYKDKCFGQFVNRLIEIDSRNVGMAVSFCQGLDTKEKTKCFEVLADTSKFVFRRGSPEYDELCRLLPTEELQNRCYE